MDERTNLLPLFEQLNCRCAAGRTRRASDEETQI